MTNIHPVRINGHGTYVAPGCVEQVFDTNDVGVLIEVPFLRNPVDAIEFELPYQAAGQVYALVRT